MQQDISLEQDIRRRVSFVWPIHEHANMHTPSFTAGLPALLKSDPKLYFDMVSPTRAAKS